MVDIYGLGHNPGGVFDNNITGEFKVPVHDPPHNQFEYFPYGEELIRLPVQQGPVKTTFEPLDYTGEGSYRNQRIIAAQRVRLFDAFTPAGQQPTPRDQEFIAYIVGTNSTGQYILLDAVAFGNTVMAPLPVPVNRLQLLGEPVVGRELEAMLANAPKDREKIFENAPAALYDERERRQPREGQLQKTA